MWTSLLVIAGIVVSRLPLFSLRICQRFNHLRGNADTSTPLSIYRTDTKGEPRLVTANDVTGSLRHPLPEGASAFLHALSERGGRIHDPTPAGFQ